MCSIDLSVLAVLRMSDRCRPVHARDVPNALATLLAGPCVTCLLERHAAQVGQQPVLWSSTWSVVFFHLWVVMSCFFLLQLVIGVLIDAINQKSGAALYTDLQRNWMRMKLRMQRLKPVLPTPLPRSPLRLRLWHFANDERFLNVVTGVIVLNILIMASESYAQPEWWSHTVMSINVVFIFIYCIELFIRFFAYLHLFFLDPWNIFDLLVVLSSIIELSLVNQGTSPPLLSFLWHPGPAAAHTHTHTNKQKL